MASGKGFSVSVGSPSSGAKGWHHTTFDACHAVGNASDGFQFAHIDVGTAAGMIVTACNSFLNGSAGYRMTGAPASWPRFVFSGNNQSGNTAGAYLGFPGTLLTGYLGRGLTPAPGTNA